jgi:IS1 family transposase
MKLETKKRAAILRCLIEGSSILATARITGAAKNTIIKFLAEAGEACSAYQTANLRNLPCKVLQLDEIWSFVGCKENAKKDAIGKHPGDVWTWTSICAETKLIPAWRVGDRSSRTAMDFCFDLSRRFSDTAELQITSDGHSAYRMAVGANFDLDRTHYAQLVKIYGKDENGFDIVKRIEKVPVFGTPDIDLVSTSYVERSNLTIRMGNRRFTRLTNGFSKKLENHCHMLAVSFMHYNFCRKHSTIKTTPAVAAKVADHQWTLEEVVEMIDAHFEAKVNAEFEMAFAVKLTPARKFPKSYTPVAPKLPWYLDPNGEPPIDNS